MVNEKRHPSPTTLAILVDEGVARKIGDPRVVVELCLLDGCDADAMFVEEVPEFVVFSQDAVAIPLKKRGERRRKRTPRRRSRR